MTADGPLLAHDTTPLGNAVLDGGLSPAGTARLAGAILDELKKAVVGKPGAGAGAGRHPRRRPRPARGHAGSGQDPRRPVVRAGARPRLPAHPVHTRPAAGRRHRPFLYDQRDRRVRVPPGPCSPSLLLADEINRTPPKTQAALLEAMQEGQVTVEGTTLGCPQPFHVLATRTRSSTRAPTRCPRPSSTDSCCGCRSATRAPGMSTTCWPDGSSGHPRPLRSPRLPTPQGCSRCASRWSGSRSSPSCLTTSSRSSPRPGRTRRSRWARAARRAGAAATVAGAGAAGQARLRDTGRHQGGRGSRAGTPRHPPARAVGPPGHR